MADLSKTTRDHEEIRRWAEERGGKPAHVKNTGSAGDIGILRLDFPGYSGEGSLESITWDQFFEKFDERDLSLLYQVETAAGERSNFNKIVSAETAKEAQTSSASSKRTSRPAKKATKSAKHAPKKSAPKTPAKKAASKSSNLKKKSVAQRKARPKPVKKAAAKKKAAKKVQAKKTPTKKRTAARRRR